MKRQNRVNRLIALLLTLSILLMTVGCSNVPPTPTLSDANPQIVTENVEVENTITENELHEFITTEVYLQEFIIVEDKITELLLEESMINEVTLCKTIYVPQENIDEFSANSQTSQIFGDGVDITSVLRKVAIGTGVIVTLAIVKKVGVPKPIASLVVAAADESLKFAKSGAVVGTVFGAFTGAADEIDETGRAAAVMGFALATVGMIVSIVSLGGAIPSGGTTGFGVAEGVHLAWAGVKVLIASAGMVYTTKDTIKALTSTDASEIDWDNIDWEKVGVSTAQKAIENSADGYMWGAVYGAIDGTVESYYHKYSTPYTKYKDRLKQVPKDGKKSKWSGERGESDFILDEPIVRSDGTKITKVTYKNAIPDFSPFQEAQVNISNMTNSRPKNFSQADKALAEYWTKIKHNATTWTARDVETYRTNNNLTWHEMSNMESMQLVPREVNQTFTHFGGVAEYNAMIGQKGEADFD
ncbi:MAG: HNH endonuclease [Oscillospiraceae bacterium]|nr:HNH endonuclease [Oscillospiraceae bacterium]